jgi:hypothetical protein
MSSAIHLLSGHWSRLQLAANELGSVVGCQQKPALQAPPPPTVVVAKPVNKKIVEWQYFTAQTQAVDRSLSSNGAKCGARHFVQIRSVVKSVVELAKALWAGI